MKKCAVLYTDEIDGSQWWSFSCGDHGETYSLKRRTGIYPDNTEAQEFYGKNRIKQAQGRIECDRHSPYYWCYKRHAEIVEYDSEPHWFFELWYVLDEAYGDDTFSEVRKKFPLRSDVSYQIRNGRTRPIIHDLPLEELERYYKWRKETYKGKLKEV